MPMILPKRLNKQTLRLLRLSKLIFPRLKRIYYKTDNRGRLQVDVDIYFVQTVFEDNITFCPLGAYAYYAVGLKSEGKINSWCAECRYEVCEEYFGLTPSERGAILGHSFVSPHHDDLEMRHAHLRAIIKERLRVEGNKQEHYRPYLKMIRSRGGYVLS